MAKKSFKKNNPALQFISGSQDEAEESHLGAEVECAKEAHSVEILTSTYTAPRTQEVQEASPTTPIQPMNQILEVTHTPSTNGTPLSHSRENTSFTKIPLVSREQEVQHVPNAQDVNSVEIQLQSLQESSSYDTPTSQDKIHTSGTQGKKGQKLPRINMAFSEENLAYLKLIARVEGCSMTEYVNRLIALDQGKRKEDVEKFTSLFGK